MVLKVTTLVPAASLALRTGPLPSSGSLASRRVVHCIHPLSCPVQTVGSAGNTQWLCKRMLGLGVRFNYHLPQDHSPQSLRQSDKSQALAGQLLPGVAWPGGRTGDRWFCRAWPTHLPQG